MLEYIIQRAGRPARKLVADRHAFHNGYVHVRSNCEFFKSCRQWNRFR